MKTEGAKKNVQVRGVCFFAFYLVGPGFPGCQITKFLINQKVRIRLKYSHTSQRAAKHFFMSAIFCGRFSISVS